jgi:signal transduction histidine kinase
MTEPKRLRVLVVEDNPDDEEIIVMELRGGGYQVDHECIDTAAAMKNALERTTWDVILSDYSMPEFSGPDALALLKSVGLDIPFIIVSGTVGEEAAVAAMKSGASDYVLKTSLVRLCPAIERELREAASRAEQRKTQAHLLISDRMASVGILAAGVAHEINNPLAAVLANLELIEADIEHVAQELGLEARFQEVLGEIADARDGADRLRHIVRDLKLFSRSADEEHNGPVDVQVVLESSLRMAWNEIRHRAQLVKEYGDVPPVHATEARLGQVLLNLIVNATQAIHEGDVEHNVIHITTKVDTLGARVVVAIRDTGAGIQPEHLSRIFDSFFTTKPIGVGTGLGLSICHKIVAGFGGTIEVESQVGQGTTVRVLLPLSSVKASPEKDPLVDTRSTRRGHLLVVDDEAIITRAIARSLESEHEVVVSTSAGGALERLVAGERFDVIVCDLMMPQMTGMEFHAKVQRAIPEQAARILFMTGGAFTPDARAFLDQHANQRVDKPLDMKKLRTLINDRVK